MESKSNPLLGGGESKTTFAGEKLSLISTLLRDKNNGGKLTEKTASIVIKIQKGDKSRSVGMINVNLADYIDENMSKIQKLPIEKCPDKSASLEFKIKCCLISEIQGSENMSSMSGFNDLDVDSDPETEFRFENIDKEEPK